MTQSQLMSEILNVFCCSKLKILAILFSPYHVTGLCLYHPENIRKPDYKMITQNIFPYIHFSFFTRKRHLYGEHRNREYFGSYWKLFHLHVYIPVQDSITSPSTQNLLLKPQYLTTSLLRRLKYNSMLLLNTYIVLVELVSLKPDIILD